MRSLWQRVLPQSSFSNAHEDVQASMQHLRSSFSIEERLKRTCERETRTIGDVNVPLLPLRVQEHEQRYIEGPHNSQTHE